MYFERRYTNKFQLISQRRQVHHQGTAGASHLIDLSHGRCYIDAFLNENEAVRDTLLNGLYKIPIADYI